MKLNLDTLPPNEIIRLSKSVLGEEEVNAISRVILEDGYLGMGKEVELFEKEIQKYLSTKNNVTCVNTGTSALHLALQACGIKSGDEVLVPSITYVASFQAITATGAKPIPCDISLDSGLIDLIDAESRVSKKCKAIMHVHYASNTGNLEEIYEFAKKHRIRVIEDAAHSFGCEYKSKKVGSFGDIVCFSFDGIKNITSGEGGAIVTNDIKVTEYCKNARLLGVEKDTENRFEGKRSWAFNVKHQGWRYHMSNLMAAIGREQLKKLDAFLGNRRKYILDLYLNELTQNTKIKLLDIDENITSFIPHILPVRVPQNLKDSIIETFRQNNIQFGMHYFPNHLLDKYRTDYALPHSELFYKEVITLPMHPDLKDNEVKYIVQLLNSITE